MGKEREEEREGKEGETKESKYRNTLGDSTGSPTTDSVGRVRVRGRIGAPFGIYTRDHT